MGQCANRDFMEDDKSLKKSSVVGIRHAESMYNAGNIFTKLKDRNLLDARITEKGMEQAQITSRM